MKTKQITTSKGYFLLIELPEEANPTICCGRCFKPNEDEDDCWSAKECSSSNYKKFITVDKNESWAKEGNRIELPIKGDFEILGKVSNLTEKQADYLVHSCQIDDYSIGTHTGLSTALQSFNSLLKANGVLFENPLGENPCESQREKGYLSANCIDSCQGSCWHGLDYEPEEWEEFQSKLWDKSRTYIFKKI